MHTINIIIIITLFNIYFLLLFPSLYVLHAYIH